MLGSDLEVFCDEVRQPLVGALTLTTGRRDVAEELAQEALVRAWQHWARVSRLEDPRAWVLRVGFNLGASWHRRRLAEWRANRLSAVRGDVASTADPDEVRELREAVAALPRRQRETVVARFFLGYDVAGTAELMGCATGTVKAATHQALRSLRDTGIQVAGVEETEARLS